MLNILHKASRLWVSGCKQRPGKEKYEMSWVAQQNKVTTQMSWRHRSRWGWGGWKRWMGLGHLSILYSLPISTLFLIHNNTLFDNLYDLKLSFKYTYNLYISLNSTILFCIILRLSTRNKSRTDLKKLYKFVFIFSLNTLFNFCSIKSLKTVTRICKIKLN